MFFQISEPADGRKNRPTALQFMDPTCHMDSPVFTGIGRVTAPSGESRSQKHKL
jgi:hypothetical protein